MEGGENGNCQSRALCGVCAGAQLIKEHQGIFIRFFNKMHHIGHVGGEGTEALLNALFIPDIRVNFLENAETGIIKGRYMKA